MFTVYIVFTFRMFMPDLEQSLTKMLLVDLMKGMKGVNNGQKINKNLIQQRQL